MDNKGELTKILNDPEMQQDTIKEWNEKYSRIEPNEYNELIIPGIWIKYMTKENKLRLGGVVVRNDSNEPYFCLKNPKNGISWCVQKNNLKIVWGY